MARIVVDRIAGLGHVNVESMDRIRTDMIRMCETHYDEKDLRRHACRVGAITALNEVERAEGAVVKKTSIFNGVQPEKGINIPETLDALKKLYPRKHRPMSEWLDSAVRKGIISWDEAKAIYIRALTRGELKGLGASPYLGAFFECALPEPEGWEKVVLRKPIRRGGEIVDRGICIIRLDPYVRRKYAGEKHRLPVDEREPFGSEKKPVHLRRKEQEYAPGVVPRDIERLV